MSSRSDREFLEDIQEAIRRAHMYVDGISYEQFLIDLKTQDALIRSWRSLVKRPSDSP